MVKKRGCHESLAKEIQREYAAEELLGRCPEANKQINKGGVVTFSIFYCLELWQQYYVWGNQSIEKEESGLYPSQNEAILGSPTCGLLVLQGHKIPLASILIW